MAIVEDVLSGFFLISEGFASAIDLFFVWKQEENRGKKVLMCAHEVGNIS